MSGGASFPLRDPLSLKTKKKQTHKSGGPPNVAVEGRRRSRRRMGVLGWFARCFVAWVTVRRCPAKKPGPPIFFGPPDASTPHFSFPAAGVAARCPRPHPSLSRIATEPLRGALRRRDPPDLVFLSAEAVSRIGFRRTALANAGTGSSVRARARLVENRPSVPLLPPDAPIASPYRLRIHSSDRRGAPEARSFGRHINARLPPRCFETILRLLCSAIFFLLPPRTSGLKFCENAAFASRWGIGKTWLAAQPSFEEVPRSGCGYDRSSPRARPNFRRLPRASS